MPPRLEALPGSRPHCRSVGHLDRDGERWACFLLTYQRADTLWAGFFSFRSSVRDPDDEVRTAEIFLEPSEAEIDRKARAMGRPLLGALLASALDLADRSPAGSPSLRRWLRLHWAGQSSTAETPTPEPDADEPDGLDALRSLYDSYRIDQVAHLIALLPAQQFEDTVAALLDAEPLDFSTRDRHQLAMLVVQRLEELLPLPPFEVWARDYVAHGDTYRLYAHTLHREGRLP